MTRLLLSDWIVTIYFLKGEWMDYLQTNLNVGYALDYKVKLEQEYYADDFELKQEFYNNFDSNKFSSIYLAIDLIDIDEIEKILALISDKSVLVLWYREMVLLRLVLGKIDFSAYAKNLLFVVAKPMDNDALKVFNYHFNRFMNVVSDITPIIINTNDAEYIKDAKWIIEYANFLRTQNDDMHFMFGDKYANSKYRNGFLNVVRLKDAISSLDIKREMASSFENKPAVIVAAGPSLDKNIEVLKKLESKAYIFACDASMASLKKHNIVPEFVGLLEWDITSYQYFFEGNSFDTYTQLFGHITAVPECFECFRNHSILHNSSSEPITKFFGSMLEREIGESDGGTSVTHYLINVAHYLKCSPIILIGQDLAMGEDGSSHAKDVSLSAHINTEEIDMSNKVWVKGNYQEKILTTTGWQGFIKIYEDIIYTNKMKIINATAGGAYIAGTEVMSLEEALTGKENIDKADIMSRIANLKPDKSVSLQEITSSLSAFIDKYIVLYKNIKLAQKQLDKADKIFFKGIKTDTQVNSVAKAISYVNDAILNYVVTTSPLDSHYMGYVIKTNRMIGALSGKPETIKNLKARFEVFKEVVEAMAPSVENSLAFLCKAFQRHLYHNCTDKKIEDFEKLKDYLYLLDKYDYDIDEYYYGN